MVGTTLILFEGLPLLLSVRVVVDRIITVYGIAMIVGIVAAGGASKVDRIVGAIGIAAAGGGDINLVRACLSSS